MRLGIGQRSRHLVQPTYRIGGRGAERSYEARRPVQEHEGGLARRQDRCGRLERGCEGGLPHGSSGRLDAERRHAGQQRGQAVRDGRVAHRGARELDTDRPGS